MLHTLYQARRPDEDTYRVYLSLRRYITDTRSFYGAIESITPNVMRMKPMTDLADDCLFTVSMFTEYIRRRKHQTGAPGVRYYSNLGRSAFNNIGYPNISRDWNFWVSYIQEHFCIQ